MHYIYIAVLDASIDHGGELGQYHSRVYEIRATYVHALGVLHQYMEGRCVLYIHHYIIAQWIMSSKRMCGVQAVVLFRE